VIFNAPLLHREILTMFNLRALWSEHKEDLIHLSLWISLLFWTLVLLFYLLIYGFHEPLFGTPQLRSSVQIPSADRRLISHQLLPKRIQEDRDTRRSAWIQETYAEGFPCMLRVGYIKRSEKDSSKPFTPEKLLTKITSLIL
jgi:hypothetical protein